MFQVVSLTVAMVPCLGRMTHICFFLIAEWQFAFQQIRILAGVVAARVLRSVLVLERFVSTDHSLANRRLSSEVGWNRRRTEAESENLKQEKKQVPQSTCVLVACHLYVHCRPPTGFPVY